MDINKSVREAIINNLDLKPSEFEKRFEGENLTKADGIILEIAIDAFDKGKEVSGVSLTECENYDGLNAIPEMILCNSCS